MKQIKKVGVLAVRSRAAIAIATIILASAARAEPIAFLCSGYHYTNGGSTIILERISAVLDLENNTFVPPTLPEMKVTDVGKSQIAFAGKDSTQRSISGVLDRVSGEVSIMVGWYEGREFKLESIYTDCTVTKRMF